MLTVLHKVKTALQKAKRASVLGLAILGFSATTVAACDEPCCHYVTVIHYVCKVVPRTCYVWVIGEDGCEHLVAHTEYVTIHVPIVCKVKVCD
jgi:hypothetical protein